jgi:hypothetical protein
VGLAIRIEGLALIETRKQQYHSGASGVIFIVMHLSVGAGGSKFIHLREDDIDTHRASTYKTKQTHGNGSFNSYHSSHLILGASQPPQ